MVEKRLSDEEYKAKLSEILTDPNPLSQSPEEFAFNSGIANEKTREIAKEKLLEAYKLIVEVLRYYVDLKEENYHIVAIWIIGTYFHKEFSTYPILFLNAMRGSGKTRLLKIISFLQFQGDGEILNNASEAVLFRSAKIRGIILDEIESLGNKEKATIRELLNASYKKGGVVKRMKKVHDKGEERQEIETFELYTPVALANIWGIEEVLADRAITLILEKSSNKAITKKIENFNEDERFLEIKRSLVKASVVLCRVITNKNIYIDIQSAWNDYIHEKYTTLNYTTTLTTYNTTKLHNIELEELFNKIDSKDLSGRNLELIFPLLIVSNMINPLDLDKTLDILTGIANERKQDEINDSKDVSLYKFVASLGRLKYEWVELKRLTMMFREYLGDSEEEERWLNDKWLGRALKRLSLIDKKKRLSKGRQVILNIDKAIEKEGLFKQDDE